MRKEFNAMPSESLFSYEEWLKPSLLDTQVKELQTVYSCF
jgi:hypothetical protein